MWHYQATRNKDGMYEVREVFHIEGKTSWTANPISPFGETKTELIHDIERMLMDVDSLPVLDIGGDDE